MRMSTRTNHSFTHILIATTHIISTSMNSLGKNRILTHICTPTLGCATTIRTTRTSIIATSMRKVGRMSKTRCREGVTLYLGCVTIEVTESTDP